MKRKVAWLVALALVMSVLSMPAAWAETQASSKTRLSGSSSAKLNNIELAVEAINGTTVYEGDFFSFNDTVGPRTSSHGYKNAINGRGVKVTGGGVAQVASTLYLALKKMDGIDYEEKKTYGSNFSENYVSSEKDAIVVDYKGGIDFSFYNYGSDFTIKMWISDDYLHCALTSGGGNEEGKASIYISGTSALENNIELAAESIYDTSLSYGDEFSFNDIVGPRTERYGYKNAINGRGVKVTGGGVAQVASVIWLAVKDMDSVEVLEKNTYGKNYNQDYVDSASNAIVTDYNSDIDFRFRYTGSGTLYLYTYVDDETLYCEAVEY